MKAALEPEQIAVIVEAIKSKARKVYNHGTILLSDEDLERLTEQVVKEAIKIGFFDNEAFIH